MKNYMSMLGISIESISANAEMLAREGKTPVFIAIDQTFAGILAIADVVKADSAEAIAAIKKMGLEVVMITGDNRRTAKSHSEESRHRSSPRGSAPRR